VAAYPPCVVSAGIRDKQRTVRDDDFDLLLISETCGIVTAGRWAGYFPRARFLRESGSTAGTTSSDSGEACG
jgi:hypothetical protein